ncbi:hypothetical protein [uncultured Pseudosulfitobacter sp.]|uniref:hypothetical protein n=1 Tax=uncultured Pseudosulfitobacter sp. TaxID=2854214 RepID=UPI0030D89E81|tara:strand:- start:4019 stop:4324 length:306 start_codon:yes stop_codon:yes gene_type:complete
MSDVRYGDHWVTAIYTYSVENIGHDTPEEVAQYLTDNPAVRPYYLLPNRIVDWGPSVLRDHLNTLEHASKNLFGRPDMIGWVFELDDGRIVAIDAETLNFL